MTKPKRKKAPSWFLTVYSGIGTLLALAACHFWPNFQYLFWFVFLASVIWPTYLEMRQPTHFQEIAVVDAMIVFGKGNASKQINLDKVQSLVFYRGDALFDDLYGPYKETSWLFCFEDAQVIEVMDEWPHRRVLMQAFRAKLKGFDAIAAKQALASKQDGRWTCYQRDGSHFSTQAKV